MTKLNDAVILVTGAAGGFGRELTKQLLGKGSRLILTDINLEILKEQVNKIQAEITTGEVIQSFGANLANRTDCETLYQKVKALNIPLDVLINNAGMGLFGRVDEVPVEKWEQLMQVNLIAPIRLSSLFVADMIARQQGHIVNISSMAGWIPRPGIAHYSSSKFGLRGFSEGLFHEMKPHNVKVTAVYPFYSRTPMLNSAKYGTLAESSTKIPDRLIVEPEEVMAHTIEAIAHERLHVFPDRVGKNIHFFKQNFPLLFDWISNRLGSLA
ncbi:SDR family NAD(P)-dependent oxidoreductase [Mastigocoleus testarum]|uniref:Short-chain dehydrogenase n=1 Tax=Mastigocoleus testarum BC008 TaxID=371196 RepID=A0A0V7ZJC3_9CYAN|nr:SDR family oxidoreductase [Mastigocoleus testarum]KST63909.1 short-chain dehydrogenase [Mastigocoleus testarum BC008]KST64619.1 short-chain dehydrogenase [Mastigocoleus testarum BC008]